jgi:VanZ family protein
MKKISYFLPALLYYGLVFLLSSQSSFPVQEPFSGFDKFVHGAEFGGLGLLLAFGFFKSLVEFSLPRNILLIFSSGVGLGVMDEIHQSFIPGRSPDPWDAAVDALGIALGILLYWLISGMPKRRNRPAPSERRRGRILPDDGE